MTKPKGFKKYFLLVRNETPAVLCQLGNQEGKVIVWVVGAVGGAEQLYSHAVGTGGCTLQSRASKLGGSQALGMPIRAWTRSMGSVSLSKAAPKAALQRAWPEILPWV